MYYTISIYPMYEPPGFEDDFSDGFSDYLLRLMGSFAIVAVIVAVFILEAFYRRREL